MSGRGVVLVAGRDIRLGGGGAHRLVAWPGTRESLTRDDARAKPSLLLRADHGVVDFHGREEEQADFLRWRGGGGVRIRLLHGGGGQGKTRFADHLARTWRRDGWGVWAAPDATSRDGTGAFTDQDLPHGLADGEGTALEVSGSRGVLIVVDYADRWDADVLATLLDLVRRVRGAPVRILLLARQTGTWWQTVRSRFTAPRVECDTRHLGSHSPLPELRPREFRLARACFATALGRPPSGLPGTTTRPGTATEAARGPRAGAPRRHDWHLPAYDLVLTVHMAALVAVLAELHGDEVPSDPLDVSRYLLGRERLHWEAVDRTRGTPVSRRMDIAVFVATLTGGLPSYTQAEQALARLGMSQREIQDLTDDHASCYPPPPAAPDDGPGGDPTLEPLYPDRLGEDFLALTVPGHRVDYPRYPAAGTFVERLLAPDPDTAQAPPWTRPALTTLVEVSRRWDHVARKQLYPLLEKYPELAVAAGGGVLAALADLATDNEDLLWLVRSRMPAERGVDLEVGDDALSERLTEYDAGNAGSGPELARQHEHRARLSSRTGRREKALSESGSAVAVWRRMVERNPSAHARDLGRALATHAACQAALRLSDDAERSAEEALRVLRGATGVVPVQPELAHALRNAASIRHRAGRPDAVTAAVQSASIFRTLGSGRPERYRPELAVTLTLLCGLLVAEDRCGEASAAGREAVEILDRLVKSRRGLEPELSQALSELARAQAGAGDLTAAVFHGTRAVDLRGRLAQDNFVAWGPRLAASLMNLAGYHADLESYADAVALGKEGLHVFERCGAQSPHTHADRRTAAGNLTEILERAGLDAEAEDLRRRYGVDGPPQSRELPSR
ncbi:hypothetical protein AB0G76_27105 [Streptomyces asoensis]|uniref:hypothetical protein n=1 Tax=Streptomyces asoensis TaxID=249586 RepID=UPI0033D1144B